MPSRLNGCARSAGEGKGSPSSSMESPHCVCAADVPSSSRVRVDASYAPYPCRRRHRRLRRRVGVGGLVYWRGRGAGELTAHLLTLAQTLLVAQVALGLLLLSGGYRAADRLHYAYGSLSLGAALAPWFYAPPPAVVACSGSRGCWRSPLLSRFARSWWRAR